MADRTYYSIAEVNALIPRLEEHFRLILQLQARVHHIHQDLRRQGLDPQKAMSPARPGQSDPPELARARAAITGLTETVRDELGSIAELGGEVKGLDPALVDFWARYRGRDVLHNYYRALAERARTALRVPGRQREAVADLDVAIRGWGELVKEHPRTPMYREGLATGHLLRGKLRTATAAPPEEPPAVRPCCHGLWVGPTMRLPESPFQPSSGVLVLPSMTAPAA